MVIFLVLIYINNNLELCPSTIYNIVRRYIVDETTEKNVISEGDNIMNKEQLLAAGFNEEQVTNILKLHKEALDGQYVAKHRFDEVNGELKTSKEQVGERDKQITELKKFEGDTKALQEKITLLETDNSAKDKEYQTKLNQERKRNAVKLALLEDESGRPHDANMVMSLFDLEHVTIDESTGKITGGFKEQSENLRKEKAFLFNIKETEESGAGKPAGWKPAGTAPPDGDKGGKETDPSISYGKSLAQIKLGMMGIKPTNESGTN